MKKTTLKIAGAILCVALALSLMGCPDPKVTPVHQHSWTLTGTTAATYVAKG